jgi:hypothetical protein
MPTATVAKELSFRGNFNAQSLYEAGAVGMTDYAMLLASCGSNAIHFTVSVLLLHKQS